MTTRVLPSAYSSYSGLVIPLTTIFTIPSSCDYPLNNQFDTTACFPPEINSVWGYHGFYSPGVCPNGYTIACTRSFGYNTLFDPSESESAYICVPTGYSCSTYISYATPTAHGVSQVSRGAAIAIEIRWKDSDLPLFGDNPPVVPVSLTGVSSTSTVLSTSPNAKTSTSTDVGQINTHQGRSTSTKAAIALGVILFFVLAVSILGFFYFLRYRKHIRDQASVLHPHEPDRPAGPVPEMVHQSGLLTGTDRHVQISKTEPEVEPVPESEISENPDLDALSDQRTGGTASERALELGSVSWSTKRKPLSQSSSARPK